MVDLTSGFMFLTGMGAGGLTRVAESASVGGRKSIEARNVVDPMNSRFGKAGNSTDPKVRYVYEQVALIGHKLLASVSEERRVNALAGRHAFADTASQGLAGVGNVVMFGAHATVEGVFVAMLINTLVMNADHDSVKHFSKRAAPLKLLRATKPGLLGYLQAFAGPVVALAVGAATANPLLGALAGGLTRGLLALPKANIGVTYDSKKLADAMNTGCQLLAKFEAGVIDGAKLYTDYESTIIPLLDGVLLFDSGILVANAKTEKTG